MLEGWKPRGHGLSVGSELSIEISKSEIRVAIPIHGATGPYATENSTSTTNGHTFHRDIMGNARRTADLLHRRCSKSGNSRVRHGTIGSSLSSDMIENNTMFDCRDKVTLGRGTRSAQRNSSTQPGSK